MHMLWEMETWLDKWVKNKPWICRIGEM